MRDSDSERSRATRGAAEALRGKGRSVSSDADAASPTGRTLTAAEAREREREQRRSRRKREVRACTISIKRMTQREVDSMRRVSLQYEKLRPRTRVECVDTPRPCPFVSCKYHLYLDVSSRTGSIKLNFPDLEVWEIPVSCALDIADRGGTTLEDVGAIMNLTRERIRQLEVKALTQLEELSEDIDDLREICGIRATRGARGVAYYDPEQESLPVPDDDDDDDFFAELSRCRRAGLPERESYPSEDDEDFFGEPPRTWPDMSDPKLDAGDEGEDVPALPPLETAAGTWSHPAECEATPDETDPQPSLETDISDPCVFSRTG
jgi:hypothetical protein